MSEDTPTTMPPPAPPQPKQPAFGRVVASFIGAAIALVLVLVVFPAIASIHRDYRDMQQFQEDQAFENQVTNDNDEFLSDEITALNERILSLEKCGQMKTYDPSVNGCRSNLDPNVVFPTMQDLLGGMTQLPETDYHGGPDLCLPEETYIPDLDVCQTPDGQYMMPLPDMQDVPPTTIPPTPPTTTMPPQGVWDCAFDETWSVELQDCVPVTTTTWPEPPPTYEPPATLPSIGMDECLENGDEWYDPNTQDNTPGECYFN